MGEVIYVDFRNEWTGDYLDEILHHKDYGDDIDDAFHIEIVDDISGDIYLYFEEDMIAHAIDSGR